jgi:hypothetical protein
VETKSKTETYVYHSNVSVESTSPLTWPIADCIVIKSVIFFITFLTVCFNQCDFWIFAFWFLTFFSFCTNLNYDLRLKNLP